MVYASFSPSENHELVTRVVASQAFQAVWSVSQSSLSVQKLLHKTLFYWMIVSYHEHWHCNFEFKRNYNKAIRQMYVDTHDLWNIRGHQLNEVIPRGPPDCYSFVLCTMFWVIDMLSTNMFCLLCKFSFFLKKSEFTLNSVSVFRHALWLKWGELGLDFVFHTCTTQCEVLCTDTLTTASNPLHYSGERWSSRGGREITWSCLRRPTLSSDLITTNSLDIFVCVFYACDVCFLFVLFIFEPVACYKRLSI